MTHLSYSEVTGRFPSPGADTMRESVLRLLKMQNIRIVVLDDDPTGIQTVHDCYLLTNTKPENLRAALEDKIPFFYILTNTRAMTGRDAERVVGDAVRAVVEANKKFGYKLIFVSRSDSTLRGHFPLESDVIREVLREQGIEVLRPTFFIPSFFEAGRYTIEGVHYMKEGDELIPVSETEFARDNVFGYSHSDLKDYIIEKSGGKIEPGKIGHLGLKDMRSLSNVDFTALMERELSNDYITADALDYYDLRKFSMALLTLMGQGGSCAVLRTSSSLPKALSGLSDTALLDGKAYASKPGTGIFIVGSHVQKTTKQLERLLDVPGVQGVEIDIREVLHSPDDLLQEVTEQLVLLHVRNITPAVYTSRKELRLDNHEQRQNMGQQISDFLVRIVRTLPYTPKYLISKGGITSHDILTKGLDIERARVMGQILPGVPAILTGPDNRYPDMPYIIFPGNVGTEQALREAYEKLNK